MINWIKKNAPDSIKKSYKLRKFKNELKKVGKAQAPTSHIIKQQRLFKHGQDFHLHTLVETGTYLGEMVSAMRHFFSKVYSIELSKKLAQEATLLFSKNNAIEIIQGDSSIELGKLIPKLNEPALFWLDGHYSGGQTALGDKECPILEELEAINQFEHKSGSVILIDDARLFNGTNDYPTIETIKNWVTQHLPNHSIQLEYDAICILPKN